MGNLLDMSGRVAVVTGATGDIGCAGERDFLCGLARDGLLLHRGRFSGDDDDGPGRAAHDAVRPLDPAGAGRALR